MFPRYYLFGMNINFNYYTNNFLKIFETDETDEIFNVYTRLGFHTNKYE